MAGANGGLNHLFVLLRLFEPRGPDASPREARKLTVFVAFRPGVRPALFYQLQVPPIRPRRPHEPLMRRSRRGRRFLSESRYSLSPQSLANGFAQSTAQIQAPRLTQRGGKTVSALCTPHCGSAFAPPRFAVARLKRDFCAGTSFSRACTIHSISAHRRNS